MNTRLTRRHGDTETRGNFPPVSPRHRVTASPRLLVWVALMLVFAIHAAHAISDNAGTSNGAFLKLPTDARGVALGAPMASMATSSEGLRWNPAAMAMSDTQEFSATHIEYYQDVTIENMSYAYPLEDAAIGGSLFYLSPGSLEGRDANGVATGSFSFYDVVGGVGYGRRVRSREDSGVDIYLGGELKIAQEKIAETQDTNPAIDLGLTIIPIDNLSTAFTARNISLGNADFPKELTGSASYTMFRNVTGGVALTYADDAPIRFGVSGEYVIPELENSVIRAGYSSHDELDDSTDAKIPAFRDASLAGLTLGAGIEIRPSTLKTLHFNIDYAMAPFGALGISHTVTIKFKW